MDFSARQGFEGSSQVARALLRKGAGSGFTQGAVRGALALMCASNTFCGNEGGMQVQGFLSL